MTLLDMLESSVLDEGEIDGDVGDDEFDFDLCVVESTSKVATVMCGTDGCGSTCEGSACATFTNDPY